MFLCVPMLQTLLLHRCSLTRIWFVLIVCTCQAPKVFKDSDSTCDCLSENWQFALAELNSSHYMAVCVEDDSRSSGLYFKIFSLQKNCLYPVLWLIVGVCCRFWEWSATSRIESMEDCSLPRRYTCFWNRSCDSDRLSMWVCYCPYDFTRWHCDTNEFIFWRSMQGNSQHSSSID